MKQGQTFECVIEKLGFGGEGIAKIDDFVVFIPGTLPGQKIKAVVSKKQKNFAEARCLEVLQKAPNEIAPKCKHFGICGGCKWQNLSYEDQLKNKENQVRESLSHIGGFSPELLEALSDPIVGSPNVFAYRNKVEFSFGYENMSIDKSDEENWVYHDEDPTLGFHKPGKWEQVVNIAHCDLVTENVNEVFTIIKNWCLEQEDDVYNPKTHQGFWRQCLIRENLAGEIMVNVIVSEAVEEYFFSSLLAELEGKNIASFYYTVHTGKNDDWTQGSVEHVFGQKEIYETVLGLKFSISPQSFFQTNSRGAEVLYGVAQKYAQIADGKGALKILDLYCGTGTIGQILAGENKNAHIIGLELLESAVADAYKNAELNNLSNVEFIAGFAEKTLPAVLEEHKNFDLVVIDPPRAGMHPKALQTLLSIQAKNIVYISCNPATLARDLKALTENGYELKNVCPVDMFPHTAHIEVVTKLELKMQN